MIATDKLLTLHQIAQIVSLIRLGIPETVAFQACDIPESVLDDIQQRASKGDPHAMAIMTNFQSADAKAQVETYAELRKMATEQNKPELLLQLAARRWPNVWGDHAEEFRQMKAQVKEITAAYQEHFEIMKLQRNTKPYDGEYVED